MILKMTALTIALALVSCSSEKETAKPTQKAANSNSNDSAQKTQKTKLGNYEFDIETALKPSPATITALTYDASKHAIEITLSYVGCSVTKHSLQKAGDCGASYPAQCAAAIVMPADYRGECEAVREEKLIETYPNDQDEFVLFVMNKDSKGLSVLIDRTGRVKELTKP